MEAATPAAWRIRSASAALRETRTEPGAAWLAMCGSIEAEIATLAPEEQKDFLEGLGIGEPEAREAVATALDLEGVEAVDLLKEAAAKKLRSLKGLDKATRRRKLKIYLLRRGFAAHDVIEVVKAALAG
jgi:ribosome-binding ATPase YchF (GTP1/OBG family)